MKKLFLSTIMMMLAVVAFAATGTKDDPYSANPSGLNEAADNSSEAWFKYTANSSGVFYVEPEANYTWIYAYDADTDAEIKGADCNNNYGKAFFVNSGQTILIKLSGGEPPHKFNGKFEMTSNTGDNPESPTWFINDVDTYLASTGDSPYTYYAQYRATGSGILSLHTYGYVSSATCNDEAVQFSYDSKQGGYSANIPVEAGQQYMFQLKSYNYLIVTPTVIIPEEGSIYTPYELVDGNNTIPAAAGKYYYAFTQPNGWGGNASIQATSAMTDASIKVYRGEQNLSWDNYCAYSAKGSYNVEFETPVYVDLYKYIVVVDKPSASPADETFSFSWTRYPEGSDVDNPVVIASMPYNGTTNADYKPNYYAIDVPAGDVWKVKVAATNSVTTDTKVMIYDPEYKSSRYSEGNNVAIYDCVGGENGYRYLITWNSLLKVDFSVTKEEVPEGDIIGKPISANLGENTIATTGTGTKFYTYKTTREGKFACTVSRGDMKVSFPQGAGPYDSNYDCITNGLSTYMPVVADKLYYIKIENVQERDTFTISESDYSAGEDRTTAIDVEEVYNIENAPLSRYWLKHTVTRDCVTVISGSMLGTNANAEWTINDQFYTNPMTIETVEGGAFVKKFYAEVPVKEGDVLYLYFSVPADANGETFSFKERDYELGEDISTAISLTAGSLHLPEATFIKPVWVRAAVQPGYVAMDSEYPAWGKLYRSKEAALADSGEELQRTGGGGSPLQIRFEVSEAGEYYVKFYDTRETAIEYKVSGTALTEDFEYYPHRKMYGFYLRNNAIDGYGLYSMYMDDLQNAECIFNYRDMGGQNGAFCGAAVGDYWYGMNYVYSLSGPPIPAGLVKINLTNGDYHYVGEWCASDNYDLRFQDMTYDYSTNTMYAVGFNTGESALYTVDLETGATTKVIDFGIQKMGSKESMTLGTLACDLEGNMYGMAAGNGTVYQIDRETGYLTPIIENTPFTQLPGNQSFEFDHTTGLLYYSSFSYGFDNADESYLVAFDLKNKTYHVDKEIGKMGIQANCEGLYIPFVAAGVKAAAAPENLTVETAANGVKSASLSWTAPTKTFDGRNYLPTLEKVTLTRNGEMIQEWTNVTPGTAMSYTDNNFADGTDGTYKYSVYATTEVGDGDNASAYKYVGVDYPGAVSNLATKTEPGCAGVRLTWTAPTTSSNGGYYDPADVRYRVRRYVRNASGNTVVGEDIKDCEFVDDSMNRLMSYWYSVTAYTKMGESERIAGDYIIAGPAMTPPVMETLADVTAFQSTWTMVDGNEDLYTWFTRSGMDAYTFGNSALALEYIINPTLTPPSIDHAADEWVITPPIKFDPNKNYTISFQTRDLSTETLEIHTGATNSIDSMTKCADLTLEESMTNTDGIIDFVTNKVLLPKLDGANCIGIRLTSPIPELADPSNPYTRPAAYFEITNFVISEADPSSVQGVVTEGSDIDIAFGDGEIMISGEFDKAVLYDASGIMIRTVENSTISTEGLNGKVGVLVVTKGTTTKVFKVMPR